MEFKEELRSQVDIVKVIGDHVRLKRRGSTGSYLGLCPFHQEKTPSFNVNQTRQFYKCFGCGVSGDVFKFLMEHDGLTFYESLQFLAERQGMPMPQRSTLADNESKMRGALMEIHRIADEMYRSALRGPSGAEARAYLDKRGITNELIETFGLGFAESTGQALSRRLAQASFTPAQLEQSHLIRRRDDGSHYDFFRGRLMFPIHDTFGKPIAFGGRAMRDEDGPKYLNSPETSIYRKTSVLYNLHRARNEMRAHNRAVLVEGYMDVIGVYSAGVKEVVASCGTAFTQQQARTMHQHADTAVINFDPDNAGAKATEPAIQLLLDDGMRVRVLSLDGGLDPDEYVKQNGADAYRARLDSAATYFHWLADRARSKYDMSSSDGRMAAFKEMLMPAIEKVGDKLERASVASDLASYLGVDASMILDRFKRNAADHRTPAPSAPKRSEIPAIERILLNALLASDTVREEILPRLDPETIARFITREIFETIATVAHSGDPVTFSALDERLTGPAQTLLHELAAADEMVDSENAREQAEACLRKLETERRKNHLATLKSRVAAAQRQGQTEEARSLAIELMQAENAARS
jgi:DNA primase